MVEIKSFKGITYNKDKIKNLNEVMSPPYDIISPEIQDKLYQNNTYNFVRLILGKIFDEDTESNNRYTRAKENYEKWLIEKILLQTNKQAIYAYKIEYELNGSKKTMNGFFTLLKLDKEYKLVKAHEKTLSKPKADRLDLMRSCLSNLEPIQLLYIDEEDIIRKLIGKEIGKEPLISVTGYDNFKHSIWEINNEQIIRNIEEKLDDQILFIADGHHRYQTAINFSDEMIKRTNNNSKNAAFNYRMVILANIFDEGLAILPTHRLLKIPDLNKKDFIEKLSKYFTIEKNKVLDNNENTAKQIITNLETIKEHKFALYFKDSYYILTFKEENIMDEIASDKSKTWRTLDVSILHKIIIEKILNITQDTIEDHLKYTREDIEALNFVDEGKYDFSVLMNATKIDELKTIAEAGEHMPQKSTYFLPKMLSGLVIYKMEL